MKLFKRVAYAPIQVPAAGRDRDLIVALNTKLQDLARQTNEAITSLVGGTIDLGLWANGQEVLVYVPFRTSDTATWPDDKDIPIRHQLGVTPKRFVVLDCYPTMSMPDVGEEVAGYSLFRGTQEWSATEVFFRMSHDALDDKVQFKVLLLP